MTEKTEAEKPAPQMEKTFPFSEADKVEIISYPDRNMWDTISIEEGMRRVNPLIKDGKLLMNSIRIKDRIVLNDEVKKELFKLLFIEKSSDCSVASCFDPRHAILFYSKDSIIANVEICFDCGNDRGSGFKYNELCYEGLGKIRKVFKKVGVKYFGEGEQ